MQPPPPLEALPPMERNIFQAFQLLGQARTQTAAMNESVTRCIDKCMDTDDLFTLNRTQMPIGKRLKLDVDEKNCIGNCSGKWDEILRREATRLNQRATGEVQLAAMMSMMEQAGGPQ